MYAVLQYAEDWFVMVNCWLFVIYPTTYNNHSSF